MFRRAGRTRDLDTRARGSWLEGLALAAGAGSLLGILDVLIGLSRGAVPWTMVAPCLAVTAAAGFAAYLLLLAVASLVRPGRNEGVAAAVLLGVLLVTVLLRWYEKPWSRREPALAVLLGLTCAGLAGLFRRGPRDPERRLHPEGMLLAIVGTAGGLGAALLLRASWPSRPGAIAGVGVAIVAAAAVLRRGRGGTFSVAALLVLFLLCATSSWGARVARKLAVPGAPQGLRTGHAVPRVLFLVADTLRGDVLAHDSPPTPALDELAASSYVFEHALAPSAWTLPSMATLLTGVSPFVHGAVHWNSRLPAAVPTLAERLAREGYRTAAFGHNGSLLEGSGMSRGFHEYGFSPWPRLDAPLGPFLLRHLLPGSLPQKVEGGGLTARAVQWIEEHRQEDFFLWVHYFDVHLPYIPAPEYLEGRIPPPGMEPLWYDLDSLRLGHVTLAAEERRWLKTLYDAEVRGLDAELGRLLRKLEDLGLYEDTLIVFASDHGEEFWEHGGFEHGHSMHDEVIRVPLLLKLPGQERGVPVKPRVAAERLAATVLSLCGVDHDPELLAGPPLVAAGAAVPAEGGTIASFGNLNYEPRVSIVQGGLKYVRFEVSGREEFYDLVNDPGEQRPLLDPDPAQVQLARRLYQEVQEGAAALRRRLGIEHLEQDTLDAAAEDELRALGYIK